MGPTRDACWKFLLKAKLISNTDRCAYARCRKEWHVERQQYADAAEWRDLEKKYDHDGFLLHLERAKKEVASWPKWKQRCLGSVPQAPKFPAVKRTKA